MKNKILNIVFISILLFLVLSLSNCRKQKLITSNDAKLNFSTDTLLFDTIFTTIGSTTKYFKLYNNNNGTINISSILLGQGTNSQFRINVNGDEGVSFNNIELQANDSIFIFVEVTIDPNNSTSPLVAEDSIMFFTNGNTQKVVLNAWGQDAYFHVNEIITQNETWNNDKPHVIYNYCIVDSTFELTIPAGTKVHSHANATLLVYKSSLFVNGVLGNPVVFQQDRMEDYLLYSADSTSGQWRGIYFYQANNSYIDYAEIKNATIGIQIDTASSNQTVLLNSVKINNSLYANILTQGANVSAVNCLFANAGSYSAYISIGGSVNFEQCTFANYWQSSRNAPLFIFKDYYEASSSYQYRPFTSAQFANCIFYGLNDSEFAMDTLGRSFTGEVPIVNFTSSLIKSEDPVTNIEFFTNCYLNNDPSFIDPSLWDFNIPISSFVVDKGSISTIVIDIDGNARTNANDLGCYEAN